MIGKKLKQQKKLQQLEVEILESLKNTYAKQQDEIEKIHEIISQKTTDQDLKSIILKRGSISRFQNESSHTLQDSIEQVNKNSVEQVNKN